MQSTLLIFFPKRYGITISTKNQKSDPRSNKLHLILVDVQLTSARHGFESRPNVNIIKLFFFHDCFYCSFLANIVSLLQYNYGNLISRVRNFTIVVRRYFKGLHIRDFNRRPATMKRRHATRAKIFFFSRV